MTQQQEQCNKHGCKETACAVLIVYTEAGPKGVAACKAHLLSLSRLIDALVSGIIQGG